MTPIAQSSLLCILHCTYTCIYVHLMVLIWEIPQHARLNYCRHPFRVIADPRLHYYWKPSKISVIWTKYILADFLCNFKFHVLDWISFSFSYRKHNENYLFSILCSVINISFCCQWSEEWSSSGLFKDCMSFSFYYSFWCPVY